MSPTINAAITDSWLSGKLQPSCTIISDNLVQPGLQLFREALLRKLERKELAILICTENDPSRILGAHDLEKHSSILHVIDCCNIDTAARNASSCEVDDLDGLMSVLHTLEKATVFIDSVTTLEIFNEVHQVYRFLKRLVKADRDLVAIHHTDVPTAPSSSSAIPLIDTLLSPSFAASTLHLTCHSPALFSHLNSAYGIEQLGQDSSVDIEARAYDFAGLLHKRHWGSPLHLGMDSSTADKELELGNNDSANDREVVLDLLGSPGERVGRSIVEYALRGMSKSNKKSDAAKIQRGFDGVTSDGQSRLNLAKELSRVLRIPRRHVYTTASKPADSDKMQSDPTNHSIFNLSLTDRQREAREATPLPYTPKDGSSGEIIYQPDSNDDLDESDPDEDLEL